MKTNKNIINHKGFKFGAICERLGFLIYRLTIVVNNMSLYCINRSPAGIRIAKIMFDNKKNMDVGAKVKDYSEDKYSAISEPIKTIKILEKEIAQKDYEIEKGSEKILNCSDVIQELYELYEAKKYDKMKDIFSIYFSSFEC